MQLAISKPFSELTSIRLARRFGYRLCKLILGGLSLTALSACVSTTSVKNWPDTLPERHLFVDAFSAQKAENPRSHPNSLNDHLKWVQRFYLGSAIYPIGWNKMSETLLATINSDEQRILLQERMHKLGIKICNEWAQDNSVRKIDSAAVAVWGNGLRSAAEANQQFEFIEKVETDVSALLNGSLKKREITSERYYPVEDYDNF